MRKFVRTYSPFLVYFVCVALAYFLCFYLFPKYNVGGRKKSCVFGSCIFLIKIRYVKFCCRL